jgi:hypothetical protein
MAAIVAIEIQAQILAKYLLGCNPSEAQIQLYIHAVARGAGQKPDRTLSAGFTHPLLLPYLDAYDAFFRPNSQLRQQLYLMFSILECSPDFTDFFLPTKHSPWYILVLAGIGARGIFRLAIGTILIKAGDL